MKTDLDWRSDDEQLGGWELDGSENQASRKLPRWWIGILTALALILGSLAIVRQAQKYTAETALLTEDEIKQSLEFLLQNVNSPDLDLISSFLSGRDREWAEHQLRLIEAGQFIDRQDFSLSVLSDSEQETAEYTISPDLQEVLVKKSYSYKAMGASSDMDTVDLKQQFLFRKGRDRWLLAPPDKDFWGPVAQERGHFVTVLYSERDGDLSRRLAADLEAAAASTCGISEEICEYSLTIELSTQPGALLQEPRPDLSLLDGRLLVLPTISLLGEPSNESGYRAVMRVYSEAVIRSLLDQQSRSACCNKPTFYQALSTEQIYQISYAEPRAGSALQYAPDLDRLNELWQRDAAGDVLLEEERDEIRAFASLLSEGLEAADINEIQQKMAQSDDFWEWLTEVKPALLTRS